MPILMLILVGGASFGIGLYQATIASEAIKKPAMKKLDMARTPGAVGSGTIQGWVTGEGTKGSMKTSAAVDSVTFVEANEQLSLVVGSKQTQSLASFIPSFNITVAQGVNRNLLLPANNGAQVRSLAPWVPGGAPRRPPWMDPEFNTSMPLPGVEVKAGCAPTTVGESFATALNEDTSAFPTYISTVPISYASPVVPAALYIISQFFKSECNNAGAGICATERTNLLPDPDPGDNPYSPVNLSREISRTGGPPPADMSLMYQTINPLGGPATIMNYTIQCSRDGVSGGSGYCISAQQARESAVFLPNPRIGAGHGRYYDVTGKYYRPPGGAAPVNFVWSCGKRKKAECQLDRGYNKAVRFTSVYNIECQAAK